MALSDENIVEAVNRYQREYDRYVKLADVVFHICQEIIQKKLTIRATVQRRAKDPTSFQEKLKKPDLRARYNSVEDVFNLISDLAGVRIITYLESDRALVVEEIKKAFTGKSPAEGPAIDPKDKDESKKHYRATHCQVYLNESFLSPPNENLKGATCEIQVCSILAHVFNEIEHDLQYKPLSGEISDQEKELLHQLGLLTKSGDITIKGILSAADERLKKKTGEFGDVHDFVLRMRDFLGLGSEFAINAGELYEELLILGLNSPEKISQQILQAGDTSLIDVARREYLALSEFIKARNSDDELEDNSSDLLFLALLRGSHSAILGNHPSGRGKGRPGRIARIAKNYNDMKQQAAASSSVASVFQQ